MLIGGLEWPEERLLGKHPLETGDGEVRCDYPLCLNRYESRKRSKKIKTGEEKEYQVNDKVRAKGKLCCKICLTPKGKPMGFCFECWNAWHSHK